MRIWKCDGDGYPGDLLAKRRAKSAARRITGGLLVTEIFEAASARPAVMSEVAGKVRLGDRRRGKRSVMIQPIDEKGERVGEEREHLVPHGKHLRVHGSDYVKEGDPLVDGPLVPHDILRISGVDAVQNYLVREVQTVYRSQRVDIDDKHIEIIVAQMLRKVKVETMGDTGLLPGSVIDKFGFREVNERLRECVKIKDPHESKFELGKIVSREQFEKSSASRGRGRSRQFQPRRRPLAAWCCWASPRRRCSRIALFCCQFPGDDQGFDRGGIGHKADIWLA